MVKFTMGNVLEGIYVIITKYGFDILNNTELKRKHIYQRQLQNARFRFFSPSSSWRVSFVFCSLRASLHAAASSSPCLAFPSSLRLEQVADPSNIHDGFHSEFPQEWLSLGLADRVPVAAMLSLADVWFELNLVCCCSSLSLSSRKSLAV